MPDAVPDALVLDPAPDGAGRGLRLACASLGIYAAVGGLISFLGWPLDVPRLTNWDNDGISILPNAAVCAAVSGLGVVLLALGRRRSAGIAGLIVSAIAAATAFEWLSGVPMARHRAHVRARVGTTRGGLPRSDGAACDAVVDAHRGGVNGPKS